MYLGKFCFMLVKFLFFSFFFTLFISKWAYVKVDC
uniref:Uncharacterized protein n=1 Tax=Rhizophora mucronata TaxID=61149 RepID=A0A2P2IZ28_RHIMU